MNKTIKGISSKKTGTEGYPVLVIISCLAIVLAFAYFSYQEYQKNQSGKINMFLQQGHNYSTAIDHEVAVQETKLEMLRAELIGNLNEDGLTVGMGVSDLIPTSDPVGYTLALPEGKTENQIGNLTGLGSIPAKDSDLAQEIKAVLDLTPLFEKAIQGSYQPWVYYTSVNHFIYCYPRVAPSEFFFAENLYKTEFFTIAAPEQDPERKVVWSPLYDDTAGAGMMVTISSPIYQNDEFLGVLSIDLSLEGLNWIMGANHPPDVHPFLADANGNLIAGTGDFTALPQIASMEPESLIEYDEKTLMIFPLSSVDWYVVLDIDQKSVARDILAESSHYGFIYIFVFYTLALIIIITKNMRSARFLATHDTLTGVRNRRAFDDYLLHLVKKPVQSASLIGLAICDIDFFKKYNDCYGHQAGDNALRRVAQALNSGLRNASDLIFRVGGEEFAIIISITSHEDLAPILNRLVEEVSALSIPHEQSQIGHVSISIGGVITSPKTLLQMEKMYALADDALYEAKDAGRNCWIIKHE